MKTKKQQLEELEATVNVYKDQQDELVNKLWAWHRRIVDKAEERVIRELEDYLGGQLNRKDNHMTGEKRGALRDLLIILDKLKNKS